MESDMDTASEKKQEASDLRHYYDIVYGHLIGLPCDTAAKAYLLRSLDKLYEQALTALDSPNTSGPSKASAA